MGLTQGPWTIQALKSGTINIQKTKKEKKEKEKEKMTTGIKTIWCEGLDAWKQQWSPSHPVKQSPLPGLLWGWVGPGELPSWTLWLLRPHSPSEEVSPRGQCSGSQYLTSASATVSRSGLQQGGKDIHSGFTHMDWACHRHSQLLQTQHEGLDDPWDGVCSHKCHRSPWGASTAWIQSGCVKLQGRVERRHVGCRLTVVGVFLRQGSLRPNSWFLQTQPLSQGSDALAELMGWHGCTDSWSRECTLTAASPGGTMGACESGGGNPQLMQLRVAPAGLRSAPSVIPRRQPWSLGDSLRGTGSAVVAMWPGRTPAAPVSNILPCCSCPHVHTCHIPWGLLFGSRVTVTMAREAGLSSGPGTWWQGGRNGRENVGMWNLCGVGEWRPDTYTDLQGQVNLPSPDFPPPPVCLDCLERSVLREGFEGLAATLIYFTWMF